MAFACLGACPELINGSPDSPGIRTATDARLPNCRKRRSVTNSLAAVPRRSCRHFGSLPTNRQRKTTPPSSQSFRAVTSYCPKPGGSFVGGTCVDVVAPLQLMIEDEADDLVTEPTASGQIEPEMLSRKDPAECGFPGGIRETPKRTRDSRQSFGCNRQVKVISEEGDEHAGGRRADNGVRTRYEGSGAVLPVSGSQFGSAVVSGLPSVAASRIAVTGRQKRWVYFAS
jgi:hypothetical protein